MGRRYYSRSKELWGISFIILFFPQGHFPHKSLSLPEIPHFCRRKMGLREKQDKLQAGWFV